MRLGAIIPALFLFSGLFLQAATVQVIGDNVNLRVKPNTRYGHVGQVSVGDLLDAPDGVSGEWVRVVPPDDVKLYVFARLVKNGKVSVPKLQIRGGPGVNYQVVGSLLLGDTVEERGSVGDWLSIAPPPTASLWVSAQYVTVVGASPTVTVAKEPVPPVVAPPLQEPPPAVKKPEVVRVEPVRTKPLPAPTVIKVKPTKKPVVVRKPPERYVPPPSTGHIKPGPVLADDPGAVAGMPKELAGKRLSGSHRQGAKRNFSGTVSKTGWGGISGPTAYRLVAWDSKGRAVTLCYISGQADQIAKLKGHTVDAVGRSFWLVGQRYPVLAVSQIVRRK